MILSPALDGCLRTAKDLRGLINGAAAFLQVVDDAAPVKTLSVYVAHTLKCYVPCETSWLHRLQDRQGF